MTNVKYSKSSQYKNTTQTNWYLDVWNPPTLSRNSSDKLIIIDSKYTNRPDLHAYDLFGDPNYWWIFIAFNPNTIIDPIQDHTAGKTIWIPKKQRLS